jgi:hypothetical protein
VAGESRYIDSMNLSVSQEVLHKDKDERDIKINSRKPNWIGHILRRNCILKCFIEGKMEGKI